MSREPTTVKRSQRKARAIRRPRRLRLLIAGAAAVALAGLAVALLVTGGIGGAGPEPTGPSVTVYSSPTCGCCEGYVDYLKEEGFNVEFTRTDGLDEIKDGRGIPMDMRSCHTMIVGDYYVEGHVPLEAVWKLLEEQPAIDGIAMPGMPAGSPGMGGEKEEPFIIYAVADGNVQEFMRI